MSTNIVESQNESRFGRVLRLAALMPALAFSGAWVDSLALRGNFRPVISSYHAICAQNRRDARCARLIRYARAQNEVRLSESFSPVN